MKTQGINSKEQLCTFFILQEERKGHDMNHCSQAVTQHWGSGTAASPQHRGSPQMPPASSPGSLGHAAYPGRKTGPPTHPTHPDGKVVHAIHLQVLGYLQIFHFSFISVRQNSVWEHQRGTWLLVLILSTHQALKPGLSLSHRSILSLLAGSIKSKSKSHSAAASI